MNMHDEFFFIDRPSVFHTIYFIDYDLEKIHYANSKTFLAGTCTFQIFEKNAILLTPLIKELL